MTEEVKTRNLFLSNEIENSSVDPIIQKIVEFNDEDDKNNQYKIESKQYRQPIRLFINTRGGYCSDGFALINHIITSKTPIYTYTDNDASMGLPIAISGHKRFAYNYSEFMFHEVSNEVWDKLSLIKSSVKHSQAIQDKINEIILAHSNVRERELKTWIDKKDETYFRPEEALGYHFIDEIIR